MCNIYFSYIFFLAQRVRLLVNKRAGTGAGSECGVRAQEAMGRKNKRETGGEAD